MAKKKRKKKAKNDSQDLEKKEEKRGLAEEVINGIWAIVLLVLAIFFSLAALGKAGVAGEKTYSLLSFLLGYGYYLLPLLSLFFIWVFLKNVSARVESWKGWAGLVMFIAILGLISLVKDGAGGMVGGYIAMPLVKLFDSIASAILLGAIAIIALIVIVESHITIWKAKKEEGMPEEELEEEGLDLKIEEPEVAEEKEKPFTISGILAGGKKEAAKKDDSGELEVFTSPITGKEYVPPPLSLLEKDKGKPGVGDIKSNANLIKRTLQNFGIRVEMDEISIGPTVTRYALKPAEGVRLNKIVGLQNNLELALAAHPVRIEAPIPGQSLVGIEVPNSSKTTVGLGGLLSSPDYQQDPKPLLVSLGKGISGKSYFADLAKMPHILIAGATGAGKSVTMHALINSLIFRNSPENLKFIMIDPKRVELSLYNGIPHLLTPVITQDKKAVQALRWATKEMNRRYEILKENQVQNIASYHQNVLRPALKKLEKKEAVDKESIPAQMPYLVIILDEMAQLMQSYPREAESAIVQLAQMSRAVGIHLMLSTQRPSVNVITGLIKANVPARIALQVASQVDSRTILDMAGAEKLLGAGDMLYLSGEMSKPVRIQSAFISEKEVKSVVKYLKKEYEDELPDEIDMESSAGNPDAIFSSDIGEDNPTDEDDLYEEAREIVIRAGKASTSYLQRKLRIGYARGARLMDLLEENGVIGPNEGSRPREVLIKPTEQQERSEEEDF